MPEARRMWAKHGDQVAEVERAIAASVRENRSSGEPSVAVRKTTEGKPITILLASGPWWQEYMRVHGNGWLGPHDNEKAVLDFLGIDDD
jgi:hypothetical protein